jgi:putative transposase
MTIKEPGIYHIYNRGNNQQQVFFSEENYFYFLRKCHQYLKPISDILAWCLMPNHFHFLIHANKKSLEPAKSGGIIMPALTNAFRLLLSSYAKGINTEQQNTGNLFQQKTKSKLVSDEPFYAATAFHYIHYNPCEAGLAEKPEDWPYSSLQDFLGKRNGQ